MPSVKPVMPILNPGHPLSQGLVGFWPLYEGSGNVSHDISGNGNHATLLGSGGANNLPQWVGSPYGHALGFDGTDDYGDMGNTIDFRLFATGFTVSLLFFDDAADSSNRAAFSSANGSNAGQWQFWAGRVAANTFRMTHFASPTPNLQGSFTAGQWNRASYTWDGTNARLFINGILAAGPTAAPKVTDNQAGRKITIGSFHGSVSIANWDGLLGSAIIYDRALSASEIQSLYFDPWAVVRHVALGPSFVPGPSAIFFAGTPATTISSVGGGAPSRQSQLAIGAKATIVVRNYAGLNVSEDLMDMPPEQFRFCQNSDFWQESAVGPRDGLSHAKFVGTQSFRAQPLRSLIPLVTPGTQHLLAHSGSGTFVTGRDPSAAFDEEDF